ncbi:MAG: lytic murein transglycosylase [Solirubrobacteraceae bacterium]|jgi:murein DD-endopeptidase MepM/ murein hydrolase activator NlpD
MTRRSLLLAILLPVLGALTLGAPGNSFAAEPASSEPTTPVAEGTVTTAQPEAPIAPSGTSGEAAPTSTAPVVEPQAPQVQAEHAQGATPSGSAAHRAHAKSNGSAGGEATASEGSGAGALRAKHKAPSPATLTPSLPLDLRSPISGVPDFFIESFQIPPFLLPIFQAAGTAYGIPWQVLAAINEVETDYGRDLSVSSAGAEGWMQFLPSEWAQYGVDANGDGYKDPYNPADAIFAAARYLSAAGGDTNIKAAVYSYNHSQEYVESVMLRAQLLGGTPSELLGAITGLTEARFPVYAASHYSDGFPTVSTSGGASKTLVGTTIYSQAGAPVIAVQDGEIVQVGESPTLGHFVSLRDAYGNTYTYAELGDVASVYPVLEPRVHTAVSSRIAHAGGKAEPAPSGPATAGAQPRSPLSEGAAISGLALGAAAGLESASILPALPTTKIVTRTHSRPKRATSVRAFSEGSNEVYLHTLAPGVQVIAGTVLGHVGPETSGGTTAAAPAHIVFQIRPAGLDAPLIDPKPILDGWVALEGTAIFRAKGENPFLATSPTVGQVLLESKQQLQPLVLHGGGVKLGTCARQDVQEGRVEERVLAMLEYLAVSGLKPTVSGLPCAPPTPAALASNAPASASSEAVAITAVNGIPIAGHQGQGTIADETVRKLLMLQGLARPRQIVSLMSYPGSARAITSPSAADAIHVSFAAPNAQTGHTASLFDSGLTPSEWISLVDRLGEIPDPTVGGGHSSAAIPDSAGEAGANAEGSSGGNN